MAKTEVRVAGLRTEGLVDPIGVQWTRPRLSWRLEADRPGVRQSAWRVRVATRPELLAQDEADLWDSGAIASDACLDVAYAGRPLGARARAWWTVDVWDETGARAAEPAPAFWELGLIAPEDWTARWLAVETEAEAGDRAAGLAWIWDDDPSEAPRRLRLDFALPSAAREAALIATARGRLLALRLDGEAIAAPDFSPHAFGRGGAVARALGPLRAGRHALEAEVVAAPRPRDRRPWRGGFASLLRLTLEDGSVSRLGGEDWMISRGTDVWSRAVESAGRPPQDWPPGPAMLLRAPFEVEGPVAEARLYATALGAYEAFLNGARIGDALLAPESTDFRRRVLYQTYDVTALVRPGPNVLGAHVGDGWYASVIAPGGRYGFGPPPRRFLAQLELVFGDGRRQVVATGPDWRWAPSPVTESEIYNGETCDARRALPGWSAPGFEASGWRPARPAEGPPAALVAQASPPIRVVETLRARAVTEPRPGVFVFDFGQNLAGVCRLAVTGPAGAVVTLRFAEILGADGEVDQANLRAARATDVYILAGDPAGESWTPSFTYHGFRYAQVESYPERPGGEALEALAISSDLPLTGALRVDQPMIAQLWRNALWSQRSNFVGIPTDCPQRDERLGWLGDACVFWDAAAFNMDVGAFTARFAGDMRDAQAPGGGFSDYAPAARRFGDEPAPGWADAGVVLPWTAWRRYGSTSIIEANWEAMARYIGFIEAANPDGLWVHRRGLDFGDWLALDAKAPGDPTTPKDLVGTAWWAHSTGLLAEMAEATGRQDEARRLRALHERIRVAFAAAFLRPDAGVGNGSQTGYILALQFGLAPARLAAAVGERLADDIRRRGCLTTGFLGTPFALDVLCDLGHVELAYDLLLRTEFPSWGYMVARGATTIWERWNGDVGDVTMNSFNHYALGAVVGFLYRRIAGIDAALPGFRRIAVAPVLDPRVRRAGADYQSVLGRILVDWSWSPQERFRMTLKVPPNAAAEVRLPRSLGSRLACGSGAAAASGADWSLELGSGDHELVVTP